MRGDGGRAAVAEAMWADTRLLRDDVALVDDVDGVVAGRGKRLKVFVSVPVNVRCSGLEVEVVVVGGLSGFVTYVLDHLSCLESSPTDQLTTGAAIFSVNKNQKKEYRMMCSTHRLESLHICI